MFGRINWGEILVIVVLLFILFGSAKIPAMMRNLAHGVKTFKKEMKDDDTKRVANKKEPVTKDSVKKIPVKKAVVKRKPIRRGVKKK